MVIVVVWIGDKTRVGRTFLFVLLCAIKLHGCTSKKSLPNVRKWGIKILHSIN